MEVNKKGNANSKRTKTALGLIFFIMLMDIVGLSILGPVAPYIVKRYSSDALMVTMLTVIYAGALFFAAPFLGKISDRIGRRPVLLVSVLGSAVGYFIFGIGGALWAGVVYDHVMRGAPLWMGAILLGLACWLLAQVKVRKKTDSSPVNQLSAAD
jgi:MFS family permease